MNKQLASLLALSAAATLSIAAPPTPTFVKTIALNPTITAPVDLIEVAGDLYVVGFTEKKIARVSSPLGTEVVSEFADLSGATTWASGRGPTGIIFDNNEFYVTGDNGVDGFIGAYNTAGVEQRKADLAGQRIVSAASLDADSLVAGKSNTSNLITIKKSDLTNENVDSVLPSAGWRAPIRKILVDPSGIIYYANTNTTTAPPGHKLGKATPGSTSGDLSQYTFVEWYGPNESQASPATIGITPFTRGTESWILFVNSGGFGGATAGIDFVNTSTGVRDLKFEDSTNFQALRGILVTNIAGTDYMIITASLTNSLSIYSLGASSVADWSIY